MKKSSNNFRDWKYLRIFYHTVTKFNGLIREINKIKLVGMRNKEKDFVLIPGRYNTG